jgi:hypothetical protein
METVKKVVRLVEGPAIIATLPRRKIADDFHRRFPEGRLAYQLEIQD